jgi:hypothetical protein
MTAASDGWRGFAAFQVFGDHVPMDGFRLVVRLRVDAEQLSAALEERATEQGALDPELGRFLIRAGLGVMQTGVVSFAYVNGSEAVLMLDAAAIGKGGESLAVHDQLVSSYSARLALLLGRVIPVIGEVYEFPNVDVVRKAIMGVQEVFEEGTPSRSSHWLGAQLRGRGEPFHPSMVDTIEEQMALLQGHGVDLERLPHWWWRGVAARLTGTQVEVFEDLPESEHFGSLIV